MKIKVCGMREAGNITALGSLHPDYMGLIFFEGSARYAGQLPPEDLANLPGVTRRVGVFVNQPEDLIRDRIAAYRLDMIQLHGQETPEFCARFTDIPVIKAFPVGESFDFSLLENYKPHCAYFLFDTQGKHHGGNGYTFNWQLLEQYDNEKPFFLSGGIDLQHLDALRDMMHLNIHAVDVNSRFETAPGCKDIARLEVFISRLREHHLSASEPQ